ncbi:hypothetical protein SAMN02982989_2125 [Xaviernesmea oryzae]|uniref:Uncharacterized protein n=1 Tax=Xaviernesmea oryzae TaxID=464029 RepID=A0A1X7F161_9HYPH|nr:hypothetical protein [Xaviernesmea oryzae]SMF43550.1 hypothetical protein SAMN02982989_2125 [Xaviernesmea oryzae]
MSASLARYLKDFSEPQTVPLPLMTDDFAGGLEDGLALPPLADEQIDVEAERAEAYAKGYDAASAELRQRFEEERQALLAAHAQETAALRERYETEAAALIAARLQEIAGLTAEAVSGQTAGILAPLLDEALVAKAVSDMADIIRGSMLEGDIGTLNVHGPLHLFEKLKTALGTSTPLLRHIEAPDLDITVDIGETALVTRMSAWSASLKKVLG